MIIVMFEIDDMLLTHFNPTLHFYTPWVRW